jgi:hypothetical protein
MAAPPPAVPNPPQVTIPVSGSAGIGNLTITPPTFLERWGVVFVSVGGSLDARHMRRDALVLLDSPFISAGPDFHSQTGGLQSDPGSSQNGNRSVPGFLEFCFRSHGHKDHLAFANTSARLPFWIEKELMRRNNDAPN